MKKLLKLSEHNFDLLCLEMNLKIENFADTTAEKIYKGENKDIICYPANSGFTNEELEELQQIKGNKILSSALKKILADNSSGVLFDILSLIDGVSDPYLGEWSGDGISLIDLNENNENMITPPYDMLHDGLFGAYDKFQKLKNYF